MVYAWVLEGEKIRKKGKTKILFKEVVAKNREIGYKCPLLWSNQLESSDLGTLQMDLFFDRELAVLEITFSFFSFFS